MSTHKEIVSIDMTNLGCVTVTLNILPSSLHLALAAPIETIPKFGGGHAPHRTAVDKVLNLMDNVRASSRVK